MEIDTALTASADGHSDLFATDSSLSEVESDVWRSDGEEDTGQQTGFGGHDHQLTETADGIAIVTRIKRKGGVRPLQVSSLWRWCRCVSAMVSLFIHYHKQCADSGFYLIYRNCHSRYRSIHTYIALRVLFRNTPFPNSRMAMQLSTQHSPIQSKFLKGRTPQQSMFGFPCSDCTTFPPDTTFLQSSQSHGREAESSGLINTYMDILLASLIEVQKISAPIWIGWWLETETLRASVYYAASRYRQA